ncbi:hypothetical protein PJ900_20480 [Tistrella mobilis]|uniref:Aspartyl/asparaginyl beta-hydroxylase n=1 Tax=Tistrella mobilis TaxID=171437 RepID=A0A161Q0D3_9PROT|nr:hypothetical protein [Tistrella mobilis]KYO50751.1 hypothetical protein AUP44_11720 [Tistrella mobilis]
MTAGWELPERALITRDGRRLRLRSASWPVDGRWSFRTALHQARDADAPLRDLPFRDVSLEDPSLAAGPSPAASLPLTAGIFHASRCGSTLVANMLGGIGGVQIADEPEALLDLMGPFWTPVPAGVRQDDLRLVLALLGRPMMPEARHFMVKFSCIGLDRLDELETVAPRMRKVFVMRDPLEILVSNLRLRPGWSLSFHNPMRRAFSLGMRPTAAADMAMETFIAAVLGRALSLAADRIAAAPAGWLLVDHAELPGAVIDRILPWLGIRPTPDEIAGMEREARLYSKGRGDRQAFVPDGERKRREASAAEIALCERWMREPHDRLRTLWRMQPRSGTSPHPQVDTPEADNLKAHALQTHRRGYR